MVWYSSQGDLSISERLLVRARALGPRRPGALNMLVLRSSDVGVDVRALLLCF